MHLVCPDLHNVALGIEVPCAKKTTTGASMIAFGNRASESKRWKQGLLPSVGARGAPCKAFRPLFINQAPDAEPFFGLLFGSK